MQRGFLGQPSSKGPNVETKEAPTPTHATEQQLQECRELLRGPGDERKLLGLLMVTRALPAGDHATVQQVYNAVGPSFLTRLLLPLRKTPSSSSQQAQQTPLDEETAQKQIGMAALGLVVLSSAAQVVEIASSQEFMQLTPLLLNVARAGGVSPLILSSTSPELSTQISQNLDPETDTAAVQHALECTAAVATSCEEGRHIAEDSGALHAAAEVLRRFATSKTTLQKTSSSNFSYLTELWAVRVTAAILAGPDRAAILQENTDAVKALVPGLAYALALPALLRQENDKREAAALHLESLHALLLILPLPLPEASVAHEFLCPGALQSLWARHMRLGIGMIFRGKAPSVQRHSALQLAAAMVGMIGPRWLFYPLGQPLDPGDLNNEDEGGAFYQLLLEVVKVETNVLLHDVLSPNSRVPSTSSEPGLAQTSEEISDSDSSFINGALPTKGSNGSGSSSSAGERAFLMLPCCFFLLEAAIEALAEDNDCINIDNNINDGGSGEVGGSGGMLSDAVAQRALTSLLDCVDVLLQVLEEEDEEEEEQEKEILDDKETAPKMGEFVLILNSLKLGAVRVLGRFFAEVPDAFEERVRKFLPRLLSISCTFSYSTSSAPLFRESPTTRAVDVDVDLEVDSMLDSLGDFVHKVQSPRKGTTSSQKQQQPFSSTGNAGTTADSAEGIAFFLPMLVQVTDPSRAAQNSKSYMAWIEAIVKGGSLRRLVDFAVETAEAMDQIEIQSEENGNFEALLLTVCRVLLQVITEIEHLVEVSENKATSNAGESHGVSLEFAVADASWPLIPALTEILSKYLALIASTTATTENKVISGEKEKEERENKNIEIESKIGCLAALLAAVLEAVADEDDHPDEAHRSQHALFNRKSSTSNTKTTTATSSIKGLGPVSGDDVQQACEIVLQSMHFMHGTLKNKSGSLNNDYFRSLVHNAQCLMKSCSLFKEAVARSRLSSSLPVQDLFKELSL